MATQGKWIIPGYIGLGKFYLARISANKRYRIWNSPGSAGDLRVEARDGDQAIVAVVKSGSSIDIEGASIMIRRYSASSAGNELSGEYENID